MVPDTDDHGFENDDAMIERAVFALFRREDLVRMHALLLAYESPFTTLGEATERAADLRAHEALRRHIASLLQDE